MNFEINLPYDMTIEDVLIVMSALSAGVVSLAVWFSLLHKDPSVKRAQILAEQRSAMKASILGPRRRQERLPTINYMRMVVDRLNLLKSAQAEKICQKLMRAGWRSKEAIIRYLFARLALPFVFAGFAVFLVYGMDVGKLTDMWKMAVCLGAVLFGAYLPDILIKNSTTKRYDLIRKALPDGLDLMVICAEAGLSLDATLMRVSKELEKSSPELADELSLTGLELGFLPERHKALQNLAVRVDLSAVRGVANTLIQAERYGTPLAHSLRIMSAESRDERIMKAEEKAARLPAVLTVPMMIFILPPLIVVLLGQAVLKVMDTYMQMSF